jgi:hypothetical protein
MRLVKRIEAQTCGTTESGALGAAAPSVPPWTGAQSRSGAPGRDNQPEVQGGPVDELELWVRFLRGPVGVLTLRVTVALLGCF